MFNSINYLLILKTCKSLLFLQEGGTFFVGNGKSNWTRETKTLINLWSPHKVSIFWIRNQNKNRIRDAATHAYVYILVNL